MGQTNVLWAGPRLINDLMNQLKKEDSDLRFVHNDLHTTPTGQSTHQDSVKIMLPSSHFLRGWSPFAAARLCPTSSARQDCDWDTLWQCTFSVTREHSLCQKEKASKRTRERISQTTSNMQYANTFANMPCENTDRIKWNTKHQNLGALFGLPALGTGANPRVPGCSRALVRRHFLGRLSEGTRVSSGGHALCPSRCLRSFPSLQQKTFLKFHQIPRTYSLTD